MASELSSPSTKMCCRHRCLKIVAKFNLVLVGDESVGKKTFIDRHITREFNDQAHLNDVFEGKEQEVQFETTSGIVQFNVRIFSHLGKKERLESVDCAIVMVDYGHPFSPRSSLSWKTKLEDRVPEIPIVVCRSKKDQMNSRPQSSIYPLINHRNTPCYKISSRTGYQIDRPFLWLAKRLMNDESLEFNGLDHLDHPHSKNTGLSDEAESGTDGEASSHTLSPQRNSQIEHITDHIRGLDLHETRSRSSLQSDSINNEVIMTPGSSPRQPPYRTGSAQSKSQSTTPREPKSRKLFIVCIHCTRKILIQSLLSTPKFKTLRSSRFGDRDRSLLGASTCRACAKDSEDSENSNDSDDSYDSEEDYPKQPSYSFGSKCNALLDQIKISDKFFKQSDMWNTLVRIGGEDLTTLTNPGRFIRHVNLSDLADELTDSCRVQAVNPQAMRSRDLPEDQLLLPYVLGDFLY